MYRSYFGLRALPFAATPDPRFLYLRPQIREALACLHYGIEARKGEFTHLVTTDHEERSFARKSA